MRSLTRVTEYVPEIVVSLERSYRIVTPTPPTAPSTSTPQLSEPLTSTASSSLPPSTTRNYCKRPKPLSQTSAYRKSAVCRLRNLEEVQGRRAFVGVALGTRKTRLAHRVLSDSGGIDLACPYPDNELAQYYCQQWVDYFVHAGHLHIRKRQELHQGSAKDLYH